MFSMARALFHLFAFGVSALTGILCVAATTNCTNGEFSCCKRTTEASGSLLLTLSCDRLLFLVVPKPPKGSALVVNGSFVYNVSHNQLTSIGDTDFAWLVGSNISSIDLSNNQISIIANDAFRGITSRQLNLASNRIFSLSCEVFLGFRTDSLMLSENYISEPCQFIKCLASGSDRLAIDLQRNGVSSVSAFCLSSVNATAVNLSVDLSHNNVSVFHQDGAANSSVTFVDVGNNSLSDAGLTSLVDMLSNSRRVGRRCTLGLTHNRIRSIDGLCNRSLEVDYLLDHNNISEIPPGCSHVLLQSNASVAKLSYNALQSVPTAFSQGLEGVKELHLDGNALNSVASDAFANLTSMTLLNLSHNSLDHADNAGFFNSLCGRRSGLVVLDLSYNEIQKIPIDCFINYTALSTLNLTGNKLVEVSKEVFAPNLKVLLLAGNNISSVLPGAFSKLRSLHTLDVSSNRLTDMLPGDYNFTMQRILFSGNSFKCSCELVHRLVSIGGTTDFALTQCIVDGKPTEMAVYLTEVCTYYRPIDSVTPWTSSTAGIVISVLIVLCLAVAAYVMFRWRTRLCSRCASVSQYKAMDDGDPSFADAQSFKFVSKPDRLQLIT